MNIIATTNNSPYNKFILDMLNRIEQVHVNGIAVVILTDNENMTGYWNMDTNDLAIAKTELEFDMIDRFIMVNSDRYFNAEDEDDEGV
jgi:hypothetical protein